MKFNWAKFAWELFKVVAPSFVAWWLAVRTSSKRADSDKKEAREQLNIMKQNNAEVQNKAYKLQFCLKELEKREQLYEKALSDANVVQKCVDRYLSQYGRKEAITDSSRQFINQLHLLMYSISTTESLVRAVRINKIKDFQDNIKALKEAGQSIEASMDYFANQPIMKGTAGHRQVRENYNSQNMQEFMNQLLNLRQLMLDLIYIVLKEMG